MVKGSKKFASTDGWGFADFKNGKPGDEALHKTCFPCHEPAKDRDFIFARYAPTPWTQANVEDGHYRRELDASFRQAEKQLHQHHRQRRPPLRSVPRRDAAAAPIGLPDG
jgi:hypothetical protein